MQCSIDEDGAVMRQESSPVDEAAVMRRHGHEDKAVVMQKRGETVQCRETMMRTRPW